MKTKLLAPVVSVLLVALGLLVAPLASAATTPSVANGVVHACMKVKGKAAQKGMIRIVGVTAKCNAKRGWKALDWNVTGPAGAQGDKGAQGSSGAKGVAGANGSNGAQGPQGSAATAEGQLKEIINSQTKEIEKLTNEVDSLSGGLLNLTATLHGVEGTVGTVENTLGTVLGTANTAKSTADSALSGLTSLGTKVGGQCTALNEVTKQANGLTGGITELLTNTLGGLGLGPAPKLPVNSLGVTC
jgi:hypothetical protein